MFLAVLKKSATSNTFFQRQLDSQLMGPEVFEYSFFRLFIFLVVILSEGKREDAPRQSSILTTNVRLDFEKCQQSRIVGVGSPSS